MNVICEESALKHGLTEEEIATAFEQSVKYKNRENNNDGAFVRMVIGVLPNGNTCELIGFFSNMDEFVVFHAMSPARQSFINEVERSKQ